MVVKKYRNKTGHVPSYSTSHTGGSERKNDTEFESIGKGQAYPNPSPDHDARKKGSGFRGRKQ